MSEEKQYILKDDSPVCCLEAGKVVSPGQVVTAKYLGEDAFKSLMRRGFLIEYRVTESGKRVSVVTVDSDAGVSQGKGVGDQVLEGLNLEQLNERCVEKGLKAKDLFKKEADARAWLTKNAK